MKISVVKESSEVEKRVAISPETVKIFTAMGFEVAIEEGAGLHSSFTDKSYQEFGAKIFKNQKDTLKNADIILTVSTASSVIDPKLLKEEAAVIGLLSPYTDSKFFHSMNKLKISTIAMELLPRITRAQTMDVLSSQSNLSGYRAVIDASYEYSKAFPMMMTAAGTVTPAKTLILGAGVAGLQAIATAKRLGAIVSAFDMRPAAKEQVESLGAQFIEVKCEEPNKEANAVYASEASTEYKQKQAELLQETIKKQNIVISTAMIPGKPAPILITKEMVELMQSGSIIIDLAAATGGNCALTKPNQIIEHHGVKIIGYTNYPSRIATDASRLYAKNLANFIQLLYNKETKQLYFNLEDDIIKSCLVTHQGKILNPIIGETK